MPDNPLLDPAPLPAFDRIKACHMLPAIESIVKENRTALIMRLGQGGPYDWENLVWPLLERQDRLSKTWSPIAHLHAVADSDELRTAYQQCLQQVTDYHTELGQNQALYQAYLAIRNCNDYVHLDSAQQRTLDIGIREFRLSGIGLPPAKQCEFKETQRRLAKLETRFEQNLLDATQAWSRHIIDRRFLSGIPESAIALAEQTARQRGMEGWVLTLDLPLYQPVILYADDPKLRKTIYDAYNTRASDQAAEEYRKWDNSMIMVDILRARRQLANLVGYPSFAHYSLTRKMAAEPGAVLEFLSDLAKHVRPAAEAELGRLEQFVNARFGVKDLRAWDIPYYTEKLRQEMFDFSQEDLRPYFPLPQVLLGMFRVVNKLYGVNIEQRYDIPVWHPDVQYYDILADDGGLCGSFYFDAYSRQHKRAGAWMDECVVRKARQGQIQHPVAYLTCNFTPPMGRQPSLLTHDDVITLFHEFGHGLHHLLTRVNYPSVAGINGVPWDAVELPSQFMENWCWERQVLDLVGGHYETGTPLPGGLYDKLRQSRNFQAGINMLRQLEFALFDFRLHLEDWGTQSADIQALLDDVRKEVAVIDPPSYNRFQNSFAHIFAGGYAAGYYGYKWAEVLSADAFSKFTEQGIFDRETGRQFLVTILEQGGARDPMELFVKFRGREPSVAPLLNQAGIATIDGEFVE